MDKLLDKLGSRRNHDVVISDDETSSSLSTVVNDLLNPKMESSKVSSVINNTLRIPDELNPDAASVSNSVIMDLMRIPQVKQQRFTLK